MPSLQNNRSPDLGRHGIDPRSKACSSHALEDLPPSPLADHRSTDSFTVEPWTLRGLTRFHVFFAVDLSTRRVEIAGIADCPSGE